MRACVFDVEECPARYTRTLTQFEARHSFFSRFSTLIAQFSPSRQDYEQCFLEMTQTPKFQNVASKMISGHYAYDAKKRLCLQDDQEECSETLESVLHGACDLNFITMWQVL